MAFKSRGVRALALIQMDEMRKLWVIWRKAKRLGVKLPVTRDPNYQNHDMLMRHGLRACRGYLTWLCEVLRRPDPRVPDPPEPEQIATRGAAYLDVLERACKAHMTWMPDRVLASKKVHTSRWGAPMTVEAMLEHAVAHPMRHRFQLEELIEGRGGRGGRSEAPSAMHRSPHPPAGFVGLASRHQPGDDRGRDPTASGGTDTVLR